MYTVSDGRIVGVRPDTDHPTGGSMCPKGRSAAEIVHNSRRLTTPLRRTRPKGDPDPGWQPIGWDEALDEIAGRLTALAAEHGPESVAFALATPSGTGLCDGMEWVQRFVHGFGSPNTVFSTEICNWHKDIAHHFTFGTGMPVPDYSETDLTILWGFNPAKTWLAQSSALAAAQERGAKVAVIDPRRSTTALRADHWLRVRPGTDAALALGLANQLIRTGGHDEPFVRAWTNAPLLVRGDTGAFLRADEIWPGTPGFVVWDENAAAPRPYNTELPCADPDVVALRGSYRVPVAGGIVECAPAFDHYERACREWPLERVTRETGVDRADFLALADAIAAAESVSYYGWTGVGQHANATQTERALATLYALTGSFDAPGGNVVLPGLPSNPIADRTELLSAAQAAKTLGLAQRPLGPPAQGWITARDLSRAILEQDPYQVRALIGFGSNLLLSQPDSARTARALCALAFQVHIDLFDNPTAAYADIVLPAGSAWEREALRIGFEVDHRAQQHVQLRPRVVAPVGASRSDTEVVFDLATRMGMGELFFDGDIDAGWNHQLRPLGLTVTDLRARPGGITIAAPQRHRKYRSTGFATPTRRVELYSAQLAAHGYSPVPRFQAPAAPTPAFPLVLTCAKNGYFVHSQHRQISALRRRSPDPRIDLSPVTAAERGISDGQWVRVDTRTGSVRLRARIDESLHRDVVIAEYGWWQADPDLGMAGFDPLSADGSNFNLLIDDENIDPVSGSIPLRSFTCQVTAEPADHSWQGTRTFLVEAADTVSRDVRTVHLVPEDGAPVPDYRAGQHITLRSTIPGDGESVERSYSLIGPARKDGRDGYRLAVRRAPLGLFSGYVHDTLEVWDRIEISSPAGLFVIPTDIDTPVVMMAGGIGIAPFLSYLETVAATGRTVPELVLHYGVANSADHPFRERLHELAAVIGPRLRVVTHYRHPLATDVRGRDYDIDGYVRVTDLDPGLIGARARFYLCGPPAMLSTLTTDLRAQGVPRWEIFSERFRAPERTVSASPDTRHTVRFTRSGRELSWGADDGTILQLAERSGLRLPSGCRVGQCESCAVTVSTGQVSHFVETDHLDEGSCLTCQAVPASDVDIDA